ncbi:MAG: hypothetical protein LBC85_01465 [Fibromonadaceae bacterium]|jgi:outer membrane protein assembly factor BamA|nr:hypothetical protein [Fibromonadaceae bacterium]
MQIIRKILIILLILNILIQAKELEVFWNSGFPAARLVDGVIVQGEAWVWSAAVQNNKGKTDSAVFARLAQIESGSLVVLSQVARAEKSLMRLGYFEKNGEVKLYRIANRNRLVPAFDLRDATANFAEASFVYDAQDGGSNGFLMVQLLNIAGTARDFSLGGETAKDFNSVEISYKEPFIFGTNGSLKLRGMFSEEDSVKQVNADLAYIKKLGWEWQYSVGGGYKNSKAFSSLSLLYDDRDKIPLPFKGLSAELSTELSKFVVLGLRGENYQPLSQNWTLLLAAKGFGMLPSKDYEKEDLFFIGGQRDFKALPPRSLRTRAYGVSEMDFQWHGIKSSALHIFGQLGTYRNQLPFRGWEQILAYGLGWEQGVANASLAIFYTLAHQNSPMDGLLNLSLRMGF